MSQTSPSRQAISSPQGRSSNKRSCFRCNQRKVGCDRNHPCGRCLESGVECKYPGNKRAPRKLRRPPISEILAHLKELEDEVKYLRSKSTANQSTMSSQSSVNDASRLSKDSEQPQHSRGRLIVRGERSRYVDDEASVLIGDKEVCGESLGKESASRNTNANANLMTDPFIGLIDSDGDAYSDTSNSHFLQPLKVRALWSVFKDNVAPLIVILHKPSIEAIVDEYCANPDSALQAEQEALILAICFAAVVSMTPQQCLSVLSDSHDVCVHLYRVAVEQALAGANLVSTQDMRVLQAAVLFLLCLRQCSDLERVWAEAAIVVRVAQRQGMHRDGQQLGLTPFEIEMRRRLWWHICIMDMLCSEDQGTDTQIQLGMFDTKLPSNIDGDELRPEMASLPSSQMGHTDITLCILNCEIMINLYWADKSLDQGARQSSMPEKDKILSSLANRLEEQYLHKFDLDVPIQWMTAVIARLMLSKAWLVHRLNLSASDQDSSVTKNDEIFDMAVEILKFATLLQNNEVTAQWVWLNKSYKQQQVVAYILSELCVRPITPETEHTWEVVTKIYNEWLQEGLQTNAMLQKPLSRLMERAVISRKRKLAEAELFGSRHVVEQPIDTAVEAAQGTSQRATSHTSISTPNAFMGSGTNMGLEGPEIGPLDGHGFDIGFIPFEVDGFSSPLLSWLNGSLL
ncbi:C6 transcription factor [Penicillium pulvis]|uniref:C6 transcription factor n=1 Tax=Penicillium pulvis TaxID=1562058 RepID=UPI002547F085|nr:C6 transcription factor [Penicillium pulvis]KAJ5810484.1 C6 transcription factor [Penicillium pulvis]